MSDEREHDKFFNAIHLVIKVDDALIQENWSALHGVKESLVPFMKKLFLDINSGIYEYQIFHSYDEFEKILDIWEKAHDDSDMVKSSYLSFPLQRPAIIASEHLFLHLESENILEEDLSNIKGSVIVAISDKKTIKALQELAKEN